MEKQRHQENAETDRDLDNRKENAVRSTPKEAEAHRYVTIQNNEGSYEAMFIVDNSNKCPPQEQLRITRYRTQRFRD